MDERIVKILRRHQDGFVPADRLIPEELSRRLNTKIIGKQILSYNVVDSTNAIAFSLAKAGLGEGAAVFAESQRKGRGRLGRHWTSPKHAGIYLSLILRPKITLKKASLVTLLAAVSCAEAIRKVSGLQALIRWPNDILVNNKKVCGILTEVETNNSHLEYIILGIGINVNTPSAKLPPEGSSLKEEAEGEFSRIELARELLRRLDQEYASFKDKGSAKIITQWRNLSAFCGKRVKVKLAEKTIEGQAQGIDAQGALIVRLDNGFKQHLSAGDVARVR